MQFEPLKYGSLTNMDTFFCPVGVRIGGSSAVSVFRVLLLGPPDAQLNPKKKVFEQVQPDFLVNEEGVATYRGIPFAVDGKGVCRAATMRGTGIK